MSGRHRITCYTAVIHGQKVVVGRLIRICKGAQLKQAEDNAATIKRALNTGEEKSWGDVGNILPASEQLSLILPLHTKGFCESSAVELGPCRQLVNFYSLVVTLCATRFNIQQDKTGKVCIP